MIDNKYTKYADDVVRGTIVAGKYIKLACKRYLDWINGSDPDIEFIPEKADRVEKFINKLKHTQGQFNNKPFILQDWQQWVVYNMFGFWRKSNGRRVINNAYIQISRKCGKTSLASALGLYGMIADGESGAEVDIVAPSRQQSNIGFSSASEYISSVNRGNMFKALRNKIHFDKRHSFMQIMSSDAKFGDGLRTYYGICDEYHAFPDNKIPDLLVSSMGSRLNPMLIYITTAGFNLYGPCKEYRDMCVDILNGSKQDDTVFAAIYELDEDDDWKDETVWKKAVPSLDITVSLEYIKKQVHMAINKPSDEVNVKTKNLNMWCQSNDVWIQHDTLSKYMESVSLADYSDSTCYYGVDLAARKDLAGFSIMFPPDPERQKHPDKFVFKTFLYLPENNIDKSRNADLYRRAIRNGYLKTTPGDVTDYDYILNDMKQSGDIVQPDIVAYDEWNASQFTISAQELGFTMEPISQTLGSFNRPTKEFERLLLMGKVVIDYNPLVLWCFANVTLKEDPVTENIKPIKTNKESKIDAVIMMLECLGILLLQPNYCFYVEQ